MEAVHHLNTAIKDAREFGDNGSRALFEKILVDEEDHVDYLEGQLHALHQVGMAGYLAQQLHSSEEREK
jgi:bacterioferritin